MLLDIKDLKKGDVVLFPTQSKFRMCKLLTTPEISYKKDKTTGIKTARERYSGYWRTSPKVPAYKRMKIAINLVIKDEELKNWQGQPYTRKDVKTYTCDDKFNNEISMDFNYKKCWLLEREEF